MNRKVARNSNRSTSARKPSTAIDRALSKADPRLRRLIRAAVREAAALAIDARDGTIELQASLARTIGLPEALRFEVG